MTEGAVGSPRGAAPLGRAPSIHRFPGVTRDPATGAYLVAAVASWLLLLYIARGLTFFQDEWDWIRLPGFAGHPTDVLTPHNEHWSTLPLLVYRSIFAIVGLSTYLPYLAVLLALHVAAASAVFVLVRHASGPLVAFGAAILALWAGSGWQNLLWAFQIGFIGSTAAGLWALVAFEGAGRRATAVGSLLLLASVMTSGIGLVFCGVAAARLLVDPVRRRRLAWVAPVGVVYGLWFLLFGRTGVGRDRDPISLGAIADVPGFVWTGVVESVEATVGPIPVLAPVLAAVLLLAPVAGLVTRLVHPLVMGGVAGLVLLYGLIGLARGQLGVEQAARSRYLYEGLLLVVLAVGAGIAPLRTWTHGRAPLASPLAAAALAILLATGLLHNVRSLADGRRAMLDRTGDTRAYIDALLTLPPSDRNPSREWSTGFPPPDELARLVAAHGDPRRDALLPGVTPRLREVDRDRGLFRLVGGGFTVSAEAGGSPMPVALIAPRHATIEQAAGCLVATSHAPRATLTFSVPDGGGLVVRAASAGTGRTYLHRHGGPHGANGLDLPLGPEGVTVRTPAMSDDAPWRVTVELVLEAGDVTVCGVAPEEQ